jgi:AraC-like DNA-binding protein
VRYQTAPQPEAAKQHRQQVESLQQTAKRTSTQTRRGTTARVASRSTDDQHLRDLARLRRVRDRIDCEYAQPLNVEALARDANMSAGHLSRQFKIAYGESPYSYLMTRRIERAMALLRRGNLSVTEVCFAVGCSSLGTISTRFTELVGVSPSTYRDQTAHMEAGLPWCVEKQVTRPVRNREAPAAALPLT